MKKESLINLLGGTADKAAKRLGYAHRNSIQRFGETLTERQVKDITMRMRAKRIKIPKEWNS
jgi:hypothetical protein